MTRQFLGDDFFQSYFMILISLVFVSVCVGSIGCSHLRRDGSIGIVFLPTAIYDEFIDGRRQPHQQVVWLNCKVRYCAGWQAFGVIQSTGGGGGAVDRWRTDALGTRTLAGMGRAAPDFRRAIYSIQAADLFRCSDAEEGHGFSLLSARRHCLFNRAAALIKVVDTLLRIPCIKWSFHCTN